MEVTGKNLGAALKLIFRVSKSKKNDKIFILEDLISM